MGVNCVQFLEFSSLGHHSCESFNDCIHMGLRYYQNHERHGA
jgi:hypothetical protein